MPPLGGQVIVQLQTSPSAWPSKKSRLPDAVKIEADMFHGLGAAARRLYAGANVDALGTEAALHYRMDSSVLPFFPEDLSVRKRLTFWKWSPNGLATDISKPHKGVGMKKHFAVKVRDVVY